MRRAALALLSLAVCAVRPDAPTLLPVHEDPAATSVDLTWAPPAKGDTSGYVIEVRQVPADFQVLASTGPGVTTSSHSMAGVPEATDLEYRVRATPGGAERTSNVVRHHRGLLVPALACAACPTGNVCRRCPVALGGVALSLQNLTRVGALTLERQVWRCPGVLGAWTTVPLPPGAASVVDADLSAWIDGAHHVYRLTATLGNDASQGSTLDSVAAPLSPPTLTAGPSGGGVALEVGNTSACPVVAYLYGEYAHRLLGTLSVPGGPGTVATYLDAAPLAGHQLYSMAREWNQVPWAGPAVIWVISPTVTATGLTASLVYPSPGMTSVRTPAGFATYDRTVPSVYVPGPAGADPLPMDRSSVFGGMVVDHGGRVHALISRPINLLDPSAGDAIVHAVHDGTGWVQDELARGLNLWPEALSVGLDGSLHASWRSANPFPSDVYVGRLAGGTWTIETATSTGPIGAMIAGDAGGGTHLLWASNTVIHAFRDAGGWTTELTSVSCSRVLSAEAWNGGLAVLCNDFSGLQVAQRTAAGWEASTQLDGFPSYSSRMVASPDGSRIAAVAKASQGLLWIRDVSGSATMTWSAGDGSYGTGFGSDGKIWILDHLLDGPSTSPSLLLEEP